jgi:hypothetical protein
MAVFEERGEAVAVEPFRITPVEDGEPHPVEADQPIVSGQPEIAIPGLQDRQHRVLRQAVVGGPHVEPVRVAHLGVSPGSNDLTRGFAPG